MLQIHVILSLVGILTGFVVLYGLVTGVSSSGWTAIFLATTILLDQRYRLPLVAVRVRSAACGRGDLARLLALALGALYAFRLAGSLRRFGGGRGDEIPSRDRGEDLD
jgi:hypothetical protein